MSAQFQEVRATLHEHGDRLRECERQAIEDFERRKEEYRRVDEAHKQAMEHSDANRRRAMERMDRQEAKAGRHDRRAMEHADRARERDNKLNERQYKFDRQRQATRKLMEAGIKIVNKLSTDIRRLENLYVNSVKTGDGNGRQSPLIRRRPRTLHPHG